MFKLFNNSILKGKRITFTGTLDFITREAAVKKVHALGGIVETHMSGRTDFLVVGNDPGSRLDKAVEVGATVLDEAMFKKALRA